MHYIDASDKVTFVLGFIIGVFKWGFDAFRASMLNIQQPTIWEQIPNVVLLGAVGGAATWIGGKIMKMAWLHLGKAFAQVKSRLRRK